MTEFGETEAEELLRLGWKQGATFYIAGKMIELTGLPAGTMVAVVTQSCTVVSRDIAKDPSIEIMVVSKDDKAFSAKNLDARGRNMRRLLVPLSSGTDQAGYYIDFNKRRFVPRRDFLEFQPDGPTATDEVCDKIGRWIGSIYSRAALPNNLVQLLRDAGVRDKIEAVLKTKSDGTLLHSQVSVIYADWSPNDEVEKYEIRFIIVCDEDPADSVMEEKLVAAFGKPIPSVFADDRLSVNIDIHTETSITLADLRDMRRFSEWDFFSGLEEELG
ncbi:UNVERIFIED_ORG: hypothetical protein GGD43_004475 [Rhizobium esperanzae]